MSYTITPALLATIAPHAAGFGLHSPALNVAMSKWGVPDARSAAMLLANAAVETDGFTVWTEDTNYKNPQHLHDTFPHAFPDLATAAQYVGKPQAIANRAYAGRGGNGTEASGQGWMYRGRGGLDLTFLDNYTAASTACYGDDRLVHQPDFVAAPEAAWLTACWYWSKHGCQTHAAANDFTGTVRCINPALEGLAQRQHWLTIINPVLGVKA